MKDYYIVQEKAAELNVSPQHIQRLCRMGEIEGAIKRAGVWFIPEDTQISMKNTKTDVKGFKFVGTKSRIFNSAINLFMLQGFNNVSLKDIATSVGIRQSTIYNHFKSKQNILDTIYDFYCYYFLLDRPSLKDMESQLKTASVMDIIERIRYDFNEDYAQQMADITKIIFQRISIDDRASQISKTLIVDEGIKYVEDIFNIAIEEGRFAPFDTHMIAVFINSVRIFTLYNWIVDPSPANTAKFREDEQALYQYAINFLAEHNSPVTKY